jgi:hypothetical protein
MGSSTWNVTGNWTNNDIVDPGTSTVNFTKTSGTQTLNSGGTDTGKAFNNLTHSGAGTLQLATNNLDINGDFTNSNGTFDANGLNINVAKNWNISGGSFSTGVTPGTQAVTFDSTNESTISGDTTFNNLTINSTADGAKTVKFAAGSTQTITGNFTLDGDISKVLTLRSATDIEPWYFNISAPMTSGDYIDVKDSYSANTNKITPGANVTNSGNNDGWIFNIAPTNDSLTFTNPYTGTSNTVIADDSTEWNFEAKVSDTDGTSDVNWVQLELSNDDDNEASHFDSIKIRWDKATKTFSEISDTQNAITVIQTANGTENGNQWVINFKLKFNDNFYRKDTLYHAALYTQDIKQGEDLDLYNNIYQVAQLGLELAIDTPTLTFGNLLPNTVITGTTIISVTTNYPGGYYLGASDGISDNHSSLTHQGDLTTRIADYPATIANPQTWLGTGLGFTIYNATNKDTSKWGTGTSENDDLNKYAAFPEIDTIIHAKENSPTTNDTTYIGYKLVVPQSQKTGDYSGIITYTATGKLP